MAPRPRKVLIAVDPPVSEKQRRAMEAAAHGRSTLGIPKEVGEEFVGADEETVEDDVPRLPDGTPDPLARFTWRVGDLELLDEGPHTDHPRGLHVTRVYE